MPLASSPSPGITTYCFEGNEIKSLFAFFSGVFSMPFFSQLRALTQHREKFNPLAKCSYVGHLDLRMPEFAAAIIFRSGRHVEFDLKSPSVTFRIHEKFYLLKLYTKSKNY